MSLEEMRNRNVRLVTEMALECFIEKGIERTKVCDIAKRAGLTERSAFRYFASKNDIVAAASFLYWNRAKEAVGAKVASLRRDGMTGIEEIHLILCAYAGLVFDDPAGIRFSLDAEVALYNSGKNYRILNRPPERYEDAEGPLAGAIHRGISDGTVDKNAYVKQLYYNAYDSILGVMQRMTVGVPSVNEIDGRERLLSLCNIFAREFAADKALF